jgi:hypothetical protein
MYHSTALLLPSGRVLLASGDSDGRYYDYEIFVPPYLCTATNPRPQWVPAPPPAITMNYGVDVFVQYSLPTGVAIERVVLMRPGSVTHHFDFDQRYFQLDFKVTAQGTLKVTPPAGKPGTTGDTNAAPQGWYMLFLLSSQGVPSEAAWVHLQ